MWGKVLTPEHFVEREAVGDHGAWIEASGPDHAEVAGDVLGGLAAAAVGATEDLTEVQREGVEGDFAIVGHDADADAASERAGEGEGLFEDGGLSGAIDDDVGGAAIEDGEHGGREGIATGVDGVGGAELAGFGELVIVEVDGDDGISAGKVGASAKAAQPSTASDSSTSRVRRGPCRSSALPSGSCMAAKPRK